MGSNTRRLRKIYLKSNSKFNYTTELNSNSEGCFVNIVLLEIFNLTFSLVLYRVFLLVCKYCLMGNFESLHFYKDYCKEYFLFDNVY